MDWALLRVLSSPVDGGFVSLFVTCVLFLLTLALLVYQHRDSLASITPRDQRSLPPGNDGLPFLGETHLLASQKDEFFRKRRTQFGAIYRTHLFGCPAVRVTGESSIKEVIQREGRQVKSYYPTAIRRLLGNNSIVISSGHQHRLLKRELSHFLSHDFFQHHVPFFSNDVYRHLENWSKQERVDIYPACKAISVEVALRYLLHVDVTPSELEEIRGLLSEFTDNFFCFPLYLPGTSYYKAYNAKKRLIAIIEKLKTSGNQPFQSKTPVPRETSQAQQQQCLDAGVQKTTYSSTDPFPAPGISKDTLEELFELLFVGADNNGSSMFIITNLLARHPDVVEKARQELRQAGLVREGDGTGGHQEISIEQVRGLPYIRAVVMECLRLMPPVGGVYRTVTQGFNFNGYYIPEGWRIIAGIRETHENDPGVDEPLRFDPDRWLSGATKPTFLTFGTGSRMCPGKLYADLLLRVFVVELLGRWDVEIVRDSKITMFPSVKPSRPLLVCLKQVS